MHVIRIQQKAHLSGHFHAFPGMYAAFQWNICKGSSLPFFISHEQNKKAQLTLTLVIPCPSTHQAWMSPLKPVIYTS